MGETSADIPVLDVKSLTTTEEDLQQLADQIRNAFTKIGFVAIINHNISHDVVSALFFLLQCSK